jgi:hypothetical protein
MYVWVNNLAFFLSFRQRTVGSEECSFKVHRSKMRIRHTILTFWHRSFIFNSNKSPTWCNNFSVYYPDVCLQLNMCRAFFRPSSGAQWLQWQSLVLPSYRGDSRAVFVVGPTGRRKNARNMLSCKQTSE